MGDFERNLFVYFGRHWERIVGAGRLRLYINPSASPNRRFQFQKRAEPFVGVHNETLSVAAMCVSNPDRSPLRVNG